MEEEASFDSAVDGNAPVINYSKSAKYHILHPPSIPFPFLLIPRGGGGILFSFFLFYTLLPPSTRSIFRNFETFFGRLIDRNFLSEVNKYRVFKYDLQK